MALARVLAVLAVHLVQVLGLRVVGLELVVGDRPRRRETAVVLDLAEVLRAQPEQRGAVELGVAAHVVVHLGRELLALPVVPELRRAVLAAHEDGRRGPVVDLPRQVPAALEQQDLLAGGRQAMDERPSARAGPDHDDVVVLRFGHGTTVVARHAPRHRPARMMTVCAKSDDDPPRRTIGGRSPEDDA